MGDKINTYISECNDLKELKEIIDCASDKIITVVKFRLNEKE